MEKAVCRMSSERDRHTDKQRNLAAHKQTHTSMEHTASHMYMLIHVDIDIP